MSASINGTTGVTFPDASVQATAATGFGFKNRIINGDMRNDQRNAGASSTPSAYTYTVDRWALAMSQASKVTIGQNLGNVTSPVGFSNYLGMSTASAVTVGSGDYFFLRQYVEGFNFSDMAWGTANAKTVTLSFQVYSSLTGTFGGVLTNSAGNRSYPFTYTVASTNTWTSVNVTIAGDTSGTWIGATSGIGCSVIFSLGAGSTYSGSAGSWAAANYFSATGATSVVGTSGATFYITGVQLEKGSTATSFDYRPYGTELALCQRYCEVIAWPQSAEGLVIGLCGQTNFVRYGMPVVAKRATPSMTTSGTGTLQVDYQAGSTSTISALSDFRYGGASQFSFGATCSSVLTIGQAACLFASGGPVNIILSSEL